MSVWTHITGTIRVDCFRGIEKEPDFSKLFVTSLWGEDTNKKGNLPMGSEGSIDYRVITNPDKSALSAYTVVFFGDLRDFGIASVPSITKWWNNVLKKLTVRQAVLEINCGDSDKTIILTETDCKSYAKVNYNRKFSDILSVLRNNKNKSLRAMSEEIGITYNYLWELESGRKDNPSLSCLKKLSEYYDVSISYLIGEEDENH